jgi:hypothetical protein
VPPRLLKPGSPTQKVCDSARACLCSLRMVASIAAEILGRTGPSADYWRKTLEETYSIDRVPEEQRHFDPLECFMGSLRELEDNVRKGFMHIPQCGAELTAAASEPVRVCDMVTVNAHEAALHLGNRVLGAICGATAIPGEDSGELPSDFVTTANLKAVCQSLEFLADVDFPWFSIALVRELIIVNGQRAVGLRAVASDEQAWIREPIATTANEDRDRWIYEQCCALVKYSSIKRALANNEEGWMPISSTSGLKLAAKRYAVRHNLPLPPSRQPGRRKRKK